jgi:hypothetical protein
MSLVSRQGWTCIVWLWSLQDLYMWYRLFDVHVRYWVVLFAQVILLWSVHTDLDEFWWSASDQFCLVLKDSLKISITKFPWRIKWDVLLVIMSPLWKSRKVSLYDCFCLGDDHATFVEFTFWQKCFPRMYNSNLYMTSHWSVEASWAPRVNSHSASRTPSFTRGINSSQICSLYQLQKRGQSQL